MSQYYCPLCKQEVSKVLYEKITGVWQEKEQKLASIKKKEQELQRKEARMKEHFESEKKKLLSREQAKMKKELDLQQKSFLAKIKKEKEALKKQQDAIRKSFEKKLADETSKLMKQKQADQKRFENELKMKFDITAKTLIEKEKKKIQREKNIFDKEKNRQRDRYDKLNKQFMSMQSKSAVNLEKADKKIKLLEEQIRKNQTPQALGLLEEGVFLDKLKKMFPKDEFDHTGKGGDIVHHVCEKSCEIGLIVYELKKVGTFQTKHIDQAFTAKQQRNADYAMLVTNAKRSKDDFGFSTSKGVIIIHPTGALVLISLLREHIISISRLKLSKAKRDKTINAVLEYIQSPSFRNSIENIIEDTKDLYDRLTKEVKDHVKTWEFRLAKYRNIHTKAYSIESKAVKLLSDKTEKKALPDEMEITAISLPSAID
jgi:hypothetical protein